MRALAWWIVGGVIALGVVQLYFLIRPGASPAKPAGLTVEELERLPMHGGVDPASLERAVMVETGAP